LGSGKKSGAWDTVRNMKMSSHDIYPVRIPEIRKKKNQKRLHRSKDLGGGKGHLGGRKRAQDRAQICALKKGTSRHRLKEKRWVELVQTPQITKDRPSPGHKGREGKHNGRG